MNKTVVFFVTLVFTSCATLTHKYPSKKIRHVKFENTQRNTDFQFYYPSVKNDTILQELLVDYSLQKLVENTKSEQEKVLVILNWVRQQWEHNGYNDAKTNNPIEILQRVKKGEQFRCVEYGIVLQNCLSAIGLPSRTLGLQTRDVEITKYGAGHVLSEVWLNDYQKWAMVDAQFNAMPMLNDVPLNAVELQDAIISKKNFKFVHLGGELTIEEHKSYLNFIPHYLFYFLIPFDSRHLNQEDRFKVEGKTHLMLVPNGEEKPTVFQRIYPINNVKYTHSLADFYAKP